MTTVSLPEKIDLFINGEFVAAGGKRYFRDVTPADDKLWQMVAQAGADDVNHAVLAAQAAWLKTYRESSSADRENWLSRAADLVDAGKESLASDLSKEIGLPISCAEDEVNATVQCLRAAASIARSIEGQNQKSDSSGRVVLNLREPLGVCASVLPDSSPLLAAARMSAGALATGNVVVSLSSEFAPKAAINLARIYAEAGFPPGAYNQLSGLEFEIGEFLMTHPMVQVLFYGGTSTEGRTVAERCGQHLKRFVLELGGKNPALVLADADIDAAARAIAMDCFVAGNGGMATSQIICEQKIHDAFVEKLSAEADKIRNAHMGDPESAETWVAASISAAHRVLVRDHVSDAINKGAEVVVGGAWLGNTCMPTVITGVTPEMRLCRTETPGPVVVVYKVKDFAEGVNLANDAESSLMASIWTSDIGKATGFARQVDAAYSNINASRFVEDEQGRPKMSRFGNPAYLEPIADMDKLTDSKMVSMQLCGELPTLGIAANDR